MQVITVAAAVQALHPGFAVVAQARQVLLEASCAYPSTQFPASHFPAPTELHEVVGLHLSWHFPQVPEVLAVVKPNPLEQVSQAPLNAQTLQLSTPHPFPQSLVDLLYLYPLAHYVESQKPAPLVAHEVQLSEHLRQVLLAKV